MTSRKKLDRMAKTSTLKTLKRLLAEGAIPPEEDILAELERRRQQRLAQEAEAQADEIR